MKWYDWQAAPNPRRVRMFVAEKGIDIDVEDVGDGMVLKPSYIEKYPEAMVPMLELDDGTRIGESTAIFRYLEELYPDPPMMGTDAKDKAVVEMWERRACDEGMIAASEVFRNTHPEFADRSVPGSPEAVPQIAALIDRGKGRLRRFYTRLDAQLANNRFITGERFTVADITALCSIDFAKFSGVNIPAESGNVARWYEEVSARPSAKI